LQTFSNASLFILMATYHSSNSTRSSKLSKPRLLNSKAWALPDRIVLLYTIFRGCQQK